MPVSTPFRFAVTLFILVASLAAGDGRAQSALKFELTTLKAFLRNSETAKAENEMMYDTRLPGLRVIVEYTGETKPIRKDAAEALRMTFRGRGIEQMADVYHNEVRVSEQGREYWLPIQDELLGYFKDEVKKGGKFETDVRYLCSSGKAGYIFAMIGFDATPDSAELPRSQAISESLAGISIGDDINKTRKKLTKKLGEPFRTGMAGYSKYYAHVLDKRHETQLIIRDAGEGFRDKVFSIQVAGPPNPGLDLYKGLRLGDPPSKIKELMGDYSEGPSTDGYIKLTFSSPRYSVELLDGKLASFMIEDDPYYFAD